MTAHPRSARLSRRCKRPGPQRPFTTPCQPTADEEARVNRWKRPPGETWRLRDPLTLKDGRQALSAWLCMPLSLPSLSGCQLREAIRQTKANQSPSSGGVVGSLPTWVFRQFFVIRYSKEKARKTFSQGNLSVLGRPP